MTLPHVAHHRKTTNANQCAPREPPLKHQPTERPQKLYSVHLLLGWTFTVQWLAGGSATFKPQPATRHDTVFVMDDFIIRHISPPNARERTGIPIQLTPLTLQSVDDVHRDNSAAPTVLRVRDGIRHQLRDEVVNVPTNFLIRVPGSYHYYDGEWTTTMTRPLSMTAGEKVFCLRFLTPKPNSRYLYLMFYQNCRYLYLDDEN